MSNLFLINSSGLDIIFRQNSTRFSIVQGEMDEIVGESVSSFFNNDSRVIQVNNRDLMTIEEVRINGNAVDSIEDQGINLLASNLSNGVIGFVEGLSASDTVEVDYTYIQKDNVNDTVRIQSDTPAQIPSQLDLSGGRVEFNSRFIDIGTSTINVENIDDNSIDSITESFNVITEFLLYNSPDNSIEFDVTRNGISARTNKVRGYTTSQDKVSGSNNRLIVAPENVQDALHSAQAPENNNPFVTTSAVIDVIDAIGDAVDTKDDLRDVDINGVKDKETRLVKSEGAFYLYDADSKEGDDNETILRPDQLSSNNEGRWIKTHISSNDHGELNGLSDDDHSQYLNSQRHSNEDHSNIPGILESGVLNDRPVSTEANRYYYATDEDTLYRDTGSGWETALSLSHDELSNISATDHHDNSNDPNDNQKDALSGSRGTPSDNNRYLTEDEVGSQDGVASLDDNTEVPLSQLKTAEQNGLATLNSSVEVQDSQLPSDTKKRFVEVPSLTAISSGFSSTSYSQVDFGSETDSNTSSVKVHVINQGGSSTTVNFRRSGSSLDGPNRIVLGANGSVGDAQMITVPVNGSQQADFQVSGNSIDIHLAGYHTNS